MSRIKLSKTEEPSSPSGGNADDNTAPYTGPDSSTSTASTFEGGVGITTATNQNTGGG